MNAIASATEHWLSAYADMAPQLPGSHSPRVRRLRERALARFAEIGFPTTRLEDWKYTRLGTFEQHRYSPTLPTTLTITAQQIDALLPLAGVRLVYIDGHFAPQLSNTDQLAAGVAFTPVGQALEQEDAQLLAAWERLLDQEPDAFTTLNLAFAGDGACLRIAPECATATPIHLLFIASGTAEQAAYCFNRIVVEEGASLELSVSHFSLGDSVYFTNGHSEIRLARAAHLEHYSLQCEGEHATHVARLAIEQGEGSRLGCHLYAAGARLARTDLRHRFDAPGGSSLINGLFLGRGHQHLDFHTRTDHARPRCTSREYFRGILDDRARGVFNGRVIVHPDAQQTDAHLASNNLLLSRQAEMDTKPQLEIEADDVKCSHGATVGQIDEDALFYLQSRGLDGDMARGLLIHAFANEIIERMPLADMRRFLRDRLIAHLPGAAPTRGIP